MDYTTLHSATKSILLGMVKADTSYMLKISQERDFPHGPLARTPCSQCRGLGFNPWSGNQIPQAILKMEDPAYLNQDPAQPNK